MAEAERHRWVMFSAVVVGVAILLLVGAYLMTRPGQRPTLLKTGQVAPTSSSSVPVTTCSAPTFPPASPLPRGQGGPTATMQPLASSTTVAPSAVPSSSSAPSC